MLRKIYAITAVLLLGSFLPSVAQTQAPAADQPKTGGKWEKHSSKDEMTDEKMEAVGLQSENEETTAYGRKGKATLMIANQGGLIWVAVSSFVPVDVDKEQTVVIRFDEERLDTANWERVSTGRALRITSGDAKRFIARLAQAQKFRIQMSALGGSAVTFVFDVRGLEEHLPALGLTLKKKK